MEITNLKWLIAVSLYALTLFFGLLPMCLFRCLSGTPRNRLVVSLVSCFAGGVFMATGLLDLLPEVNETFGKSAWGHGYPVAEFFVAIGFFLILTVEQIVLFIKEGSPGPPPLPSDSTDSIDEEDASGPPRDDQHDSQRFEGSLQGVSNQPLISSTSSSGSSSSSSIGYLIDAPVHPPYLRTSLLAGALSLHSVFEGVAIGLQQDQDKLLQIFAAVALHKSVIAFSLGTKLLSSIPRPSLWLPSIVLFSLTSPLGISATISLDKYTEDLNSVLVNGSLQGLACGTFFYVTFFELLPHELNEGGNRPLKLLAIILGFSLVAALLFLDPDNHKAAKATAAFLPASASNVHLL